MNKGVGTVGTPQIYCGIKKLNFYSKNEWLLRNCAQIASCKCSLRSDYLNHFLSWPAKTLAFYCPLLPSYSLSVSLIPLVPDDTTCRLSLCTEP